MTLRIVVCKQYAYLQGVSLCWHTLLCVFILTDINTAGSLRKQLKNSVFSSNILIDVVESSRTSLILLNSPLNITRCSCSTQDQIDVLSLTKVKQLLKIFMVTVAWKATHQHVACGWKSNIHQYNKENCG